MDAARVLLVLAAGISALLAMTPRWLFPVCSAKVSTATGGLVPMKCAWSANVLIALGVLAAGIATVGALWKRPGPVAASALSLAGVFIVALLVPTALIGVCAAPTHPCHAGTLPATLSEAGLGLVLSLPAVGLAAVAGRFESDDRARQRE